MFDHLVTLVYRLIFEQDPPCMLEEGMKEFLAIVDWYDSPNDTFIIVFSVEKLLHVRPKFALDVLIMWEVAYHISVGLTTRMQRKNKAPWPTLPLQIGLYKIEALSKWMLKLKK